MKNLSKSTFILSFALLLSLFYSCNNSKSKDSKMLAALKPFSEHETIKQFKHLAVLPGYIDKKIFINCNYCNFFKDSITYHSDLLITTSDSLNNIMNPKVYIKTRNESIIEDSIYFDFDIFVKNKKEGEGSYYYFEEPNENGTKYKYHLESRFPSQKEIKNTEVDSSSRKYVDMMIEFAKMDDAAEFQDLNFTGKLWQSKVFISENSENPILDTLFIGSDIIIMTDEMIKENEVDSYVYPDSILISNDSCYMEFSYLFKDKKIAEGNFSLVPFIANEVYDLNNFRKRINVTITH